MCSLDGEQLQSIELTIRAGGQPFRPPEVSPETIQRWASRNTKVIGSPLSTAAAAKSPHR